MSLEGNWELESSENEEELLKHIGKIITVMIRVTTTKNCYYH